MMKWKVMKTSRWNSADHEDVRRSLEILDNVLAEFDDGIGDVSSPFAGIKNEENKQMEKTTINGEAKNAAVESNYYETDGNFCSHQYLTNSAQAIKDGATSQTELSSPDDKNFSPPPVPKRNPATRLSSRENLTLSESFENIYANSFEIHRNVFDIKDGYRHLATNQSPNVKQKIKTDHEVTLSSKSSNQSTNADVITKRTSKEISNSSSIEDNDDVFVSRTKLSLCRSASASVMTVETLPKSPTVANRRAFYENSNMCPSEDTKRHVIHSDSSDASFSVRNSPFLKKKFPIAASSKFHKRNISDSTYCKSLEDPESLKNGVHRSHTFKDPGIPKDSSTGILKDSSNIRPLRETTEERIARLNKKFAEIRHLLRTKQIKPLECDPPRFVPTPPPQKIARRYENDAKFNFAEKSENLESVNVHNDLFPQNDKNLLKPSTNLVNTISDISCMLPTDTLIRPHLGLSYCMEDDLSPGVKELLTSTPKSDKSMLGLSTFSQSFSSLGYGSGQSDSDLNSSLSEENKKVPVTNLKSQTLPIGMRLDPSFSYSTDISYDCDTEDIVKVDGIDVQTNSEIANFRSSSAPPIKHLLQRKNKFGMSKKETKDKNDNISLKSDISCDDGVILRKITTLDGSTKTNDLSGRKQTNVNSEEKTKRKSVWKSILRRK